MASMSFQLPKSAVDQLKGFISLCKSKPEIIHNEELTFFREYLLSMGANLPPKPEGETAGGEKKQQETPTPTPEAAKEEPAEMEVESEESDVELDMSGVIGDPNPGIDQDMGDPTKKELTDQEMESFDEKRSQAMQTFSEVSKIGSKESVGDYIIFYFKGEWEKAIIVFTDAIKINPNSAAMFAKRGMCYLKMTPKSTAACVKVNGEWLARGLISSFRTAAEQLN